MKCSLEGRKLGGSQKVGGEERLRIQSVFYLYSFNHYLLNTQYVTGEGNGNPLQYSCLENPRDGGAWWAAVYGVAQSWTRLKRLSSSSSMYQALF